MTNRLLFGEGVVRLTYRGTGSNACVRLVAPKPDSGLTTARVRWSVPTARRSAAGKEGLLDGTTKIELRTKRLDTNGNCEFGVNGIYYMFQVGVGYFYDLVEGKFYGNEGSGSFYWGAIFLSDI